MLWGVEDRVVERFVNAGVPKENISFSKETFTFNAPYSPTELVGNFKNYYGPTMNAFEAAAKDGRADQLETELLTLFEEHNRAGPAKTEIPAAFLKVTVRKG
jgi:hypothetical protein